MTIDLAALDFTFSKKPLVVGGKAMEYYGLRASGNDVDLVVPKEDLEKLARKYPTRIRDISGDLGIIVHGFEIWKTIRYYNYGFLSEGAIEHDQYLIISLEKLLFLKALAMTDPKYHKDLELIVEKIASNQAKKFQQIKDENNTVCYHKVN